MHAGRVLVTGASGFIGRWSVRALLARGYEVHAVCTQPGRGLPDALRGARVHAADLLDGPALNALLAAVRPSHLLHFAWIATPGVYWSSPQNRRWLDAGRQLLSVFTAQGGRRAVMAGSCAEYDWSKGGVCDERSSALADAAPTVSLYAECKLAMARTLQEFATSHGLSTAWGRIFFQYGPAEHPDRLVSSVINHLLSGHAALVSHGRQIRSFLHVADVGDAFAALLDSNVQGPVNIGSAERLEIRDLMELIAGQIGRPELLRLGARAAPAGEPALLVPALSRLGGEVGWQPRFTLPEGIADTIAWWRTGRLR